MQTATITIVVESDGNAFGANGNTINDKAMAKLKAGDYTCDITDAPEQPANPN